MDRRVVVTGLGPISSIGIGRQEFGRALHAGREGAKPIRAFDTTGFDSDIACEVDGFDAAVLIQSPAIRSRGRATQFAVAAARMAVEDAGLRPADLGDEPVVIAMGTTNAETRQLDHLVEHELGCYQGTRTPTELAAAADPGLAASSIAEELGLGGAEAVVLGTACAAGNYALGYGYDAIRSGEVDVAICGGVDAFCRKTFTGFYRLGTVAPRSCQPFDAGRRGILPSEGAGVLVLESLSSARARGAHVLAELLGYAMNCDASHPVAPDRESIARCIAAAHRRAGVTPAMIDLVSAHGTGTRANDTTEVGALRDVFGDALPPTIGLKSMLGHAMGAASSLAAIACVLAIDEDFIPPTINHVTPDPECAIDCVPNVARPARLSVVQNNGFAFGGNNAITVLGRYEPASPDGTP